MQFAFGRKKGEETEREREKENKKDGF